MSARYVIGWLVFSVAGLSVPARGAAQGYQFDLTPRLVAYMHTSDVGAAAPAQGPWYLRLDQIESIGALELESRLIWPSSRFALRLLGLATLPGEVSGVFDCYPGFACPDVLLRSNAEAWVLAAAVDAQYTMRPADRAIRPFASFGVGLKRYRFSWPDAEVLVSGGDFAETSPVLRAGLGAEFNVRDQSIRVECADWWSSEGGILSDEAGSSGQPPRRRAQHDIAVSIGWRLLRF